MHWAPRLDSSLGITVVELTSKRKLRREAADEQGYLMSGVRRVQQGKLLSMCSPRQLPPNQLVPEVAGEVEPLGRFLPLPRRSNRPLADGGERKKTTQS
ncbi:hypothetical protein B723_25175 [Pseudomonas fluorescens NCIMB 11764]|uniref:Uncharacterized protein n=1 Tax=Pseudomonas fluorescens NCIMB 11764 TaxID=1221522 RepID=A0A0K1QV14_PSEFL|nr:hypothetical protein B723_25175 [Pseudomonas fluorescens NCIMB 11764]